MKKVFLGISIFIVSAILLVMIAGGIYIASVPNVPFDQKAVDTMDKVTLFYDRYDTQLKACRQGKYATYVKLEDLPHHVPSAFVAVEDKRFYSHNGIDYKRMLGAALNNFKTRRYSQGASTITQQLAKNTHLSSEKNMKRKIQEIRLAKKIEKTYTKDEILERYINIVYFGKNAYGIESAARTFFSKNAANLTVAEAAMLAGIINSPAGNSPIHHYENAFLRKNLVLKLLGEQGFLDESQRQAAESERPTITLTESAEEYYIAAAKAEAETIAKNVGLKNLNGCKVYTAFDTIGQNSIFHQLNTRKKYYAKAVIINNETGMVESVYGNDDETSKMRRQPGSCIKPIAVYAPAIERGVLTPATPILDEPINYDGYRPQNFEKKHFGWISARRALATSNNIAAVKTFGYAGLDYSIDFARAQGLPLDNLDKHYATALGGISGGVKLEELTRSYAVLARDGKSANGNYVRKIIGANDNILYEAPSLQTQSMSTETAQLVTDMMRTCVTDGTASKLKRLPFDVAAKTGTVGYKDTAKNTDAYCVGFTTQYTLGVWIGSRTTDETDALPTEIRGGTMPTAISEHIFRDIHKTSPKPFTHGDSLNEIRLDAKLYRDQKLVEAPSFLKDNATITELFGTRLRPQRYIYADPTIDVQLDEYGVKISYSGDYYANHVLLRSSMRDIIQRNLDQNVQLNQNVYDYDVNSGQIYNYQIVSSFPNGDVRLSRSIRVYIP